MASPDPLAGTQEEFSIGNWKEAVRNFRPSGPNSFSQDGGEAALVGYVPAVKVRGALRFFLGYNSVTAAAPFLIQRTNPVYHPRYPNLICTSAAEDEFDPGSPEDLGAPPTLKHEANRALPGAPRFTLPDITHRAGYDQARITLRFTPIAWQLVEDGPGFNRLVNEFARNTWIDVDPKVEVLSLDGFTLKYAEGQGNAPPLSNPFGQDFPAPFGQLLVKPDVVMHWKHVPGNFVTPSSGITSFPTNICRCLGKLNNDVFKGYPAGTLLLLGAKLTRTNWVLAMGGESYHNFNIAFFFSFFDPPKGKTANVTITTERGHNNMPWRGTFAAGDTNAGKWFLATRTGGSGVAAVDPRLIEYADFVTMFQQAV